MTAAARSLRRFASSGTMAWARRELAFRPLWALLAAATALRAATMALYFPAVIQLPDSVRFVRAPPGWEGMFSDYWMPAGYAFVLRGLRLFSDQVWLAISFQHLVGLLAGLAIYLAMRRLELPRWVAMIPAGVYLLSGDVLFLEHLLMTDQQALALTALALCAAVFGLHPKLDLRWLAGAGALAGAAWMTRSPSVVVVVVVGATAIAASGRGARARAGLAALAGAACIFGAYLLAYELSNGQYLGLSDMKGWDLQARVQPFADCNEFDVPQESSALCQTTPPSEREGPFHYVWDQRSISLRNFEEGPQTDDVMWAYATAAIRGQPLDYIQAVASDLPRYIRDPRPGDRKRDGLGHPALSFANRNIFNEAIVRAWIDPVYDGTEVSAPGDEVLGAYQQIVRVHGALIAALLLLTLAGAIWGRGPARLGVALFGATTLLLYIAPTATHGFDFRYGIPASTLLACAGTLAAWSLWLRRSEPGEESKLSASAP